ncbi:uncharacterized protein LOC128740249 [Sabethes cyaneus]|uniref:uncharacterized protein LOC128740249 n=1 Tax=Sabethes cyaneus TaxID=53552 RepID=UPI00237DE268|nr:uncharacterized protein LOC128740249 [Sabethes cyaneus]
MNNPGDNLNETEVTGCNCMVCNEPDHADVGMVGCDNCSQWFHFKCVGVSADVKDVSWHCKECEAKTVEARGEFGREKKHADDSKVLSGSTPEDIIFSSELVDLERELEKIEEVRRMQLKKMELEKIVHRRRLEIQRELAEQKLALEREKRQMELDMEKEQLQKAIAEEEAFFKEQQAMRSELEGKLQQLQLQRKKSSSEVKALCAGSSEKGADMETERQPKDYRGTYSKHSTPMRARKNPLVENNRKTEDHLTVIGDDSTSESDCGTSKGSQSVQRLQKGPTKAQLSARQFLAKKLPVFTGRSEDWPMFISSFETTNEACGFSNVENLARLQECLKGQALESVRSRLLLPEAVPQIIESLRMLYGRPEQLLYTLLMKVRKAEPPKAERLNTYITFGTIVQQLVDHLEATNLKDHLVNPMLIQELVEKLPASTKMEWVRHKRQEKHVTLRTLADFLSEIVRDASEVTMFHEVPSTMLENRLSKKFRNNREGYVQSYSAVSDAEDSELQQRRIPCPMCDRTDHRIRNCADFRKLNPIDRLAVVNEWELCQVCLNDHGDAECKLNIVCKAAGCGQHHNTLLHQSHAVTTECNIHSQTRDERVMFRIAAVTLYNGNRSINTLAFLDEGSSYTLVESSLADQLKVEGFNQPLRVSWTAGMSRLERDSQQLHLTISAHGSKNRFKIQNVHTVKELKLPEQNLCYTDVAMQYKHLQNLPVLDYAMEPPKILIGLKHLHLFAPLESRVGKPGEPIAVRTKLGWTIYGPQIWNKCLPSYIGHHAFTDLTADLLPESSEDKRTRENFEITAVMVGNRCQREQLRRDDSGSGDNEKRERQRLREQERKLREEQRRHREIRSRQRREEQLLRRERTCVINPKVETRRDKSKSIVDLLICRSLRDSVSLSLLKQQTL